MDKILVFDPGESTGYVKVINRQLTGGTIIRDRSAIWNMLNSTEPDLIIFETFRLYSTHAQSMINNTFYTCEIIGLFKLYRDLHNQVTLVEQGASAKKYSNARSSDPEWTSLRATSDSIITDHTFDAYMHWCFYRRNTNGKK